MCPKICHLFHSSEALTIAVPSEGYHIQLTPKYSWPDYHRHFLKRKNSVHTGFSRGRSGGLVFPSLAEFSTVYCGKSKALA